MKKIFLTTLVCLTAFFCTGCVQENYDIEINNKDLVSLTYTKNLQYRPMQSPKFRESIQKDLQKNIQQYEDSGFEVKTELEENGNCFITLKKANLSPIKTAKILPKGFNTNGGNWLEIKKTLIKKHYKIHLTYNLKDALNSENTELFNFKNSSEAFKLYQNALEQIVVSRTKQKDSLGFDYISTEYASGNKIMEKYDEDAKLIIPQSPKAEITIKIPTKSTSNNATNVVNNTTYQWIITEEQPVEILLDYERWDFSPLAMVISILVVVGGALFVAKKAYSKEPVNGL